EPPWECDYSSYAFVTDGRIACRYRHQGRDRLALLDPQSRRRRDLSIPYTSLKPYLRAVGDRLAFIGASPPASSAVAILHVPTGDLDVLAGAEVSLDPAWVSVPQPIQFPARAGQTAHAPHFFPSRGFAVVDVNYAGSTGYGRGYRERLTGQWGLADVSDCLDAARSLVEGGGGGGGWAAAGDQRGKCRWLHGLVRARCR